MRPLGWRGWLGVGLVLMVALAAAVAIWFGVLAGLAILLGF